VKEKIAIFLSNDEFSKYSYNKVKKNFIPFPFSFEPIDFLKTNIISPYNFSEIFNFFKKEKIEKIVLIGKISPTVLFEKNFDFVSRKLLKKSTNFTGEEVLKNVISFLGKYEIDVLSLKTLFKDEIAEKKIYCGSLNKREKEDIKIGYSFLSDIEKYRCGQSVIIKNGMIIAVEGIEGTDKMIKRGGEYCSDFVFVKIAGKNKDERFDLPVIGPDTIELIKKTKGKVVAIESGKTIIFHKNKVIEMCQKSNISLIGI